MSKLDGARLLDEMIADPQGFSNSGHAYNLLQAYFSGFPKETLRAPLESNNVWIQRSAGFVVSELGSAARSLVSAIPRLLSSPDEHVVWYGMEALAVCANGESAFQFAGVVLILDAISEPLRRLAMRLMTRVDVSQLEAARDHLDATAGGFETHVRALTDLVDDQINEVLIGNMLGHSIGLIRRYGAIAAIRYQARFPALESRLKSSNDADVRSLIS